MSYCCGTCRNLDTNDGLDALYEIAAVIGWDKLAAQLREQASDPVIQAKVAELQAKAEVKRAEQEAEHNRREYARALKRAQKRTKRVFGKPPVGEPVIGPPIPLDFS